MYFGEQSNNREDFMTNRLSHSAATRFQACPKEYELHYIEGYRTKYQSSALLFGSSVDKAFEALAGGNDPYEVFDKVWAFQEVNKQLEFLPECEKIIYSDSEFDEQLLTEKHFEKLRNWLVEYKVPGEPIEIFNAIKAEKKQCGYKNLDVTKQKYYNLANWCCLERKGHLMIEALKTKVLPKLGTILATQKKIELINQEGDSVLGFVDLVCLYEGEPVVFDLKTSSITYEEDSVLTSSQLSLYVHALYNEYKTRTAGYIVLNKKVMKNKTKVCTLCSHDGSGSRARTCDNTIEEKRCGGEWKESIKPEIFVQFIVSNIPETTENIVLENLDFINQMVTRGVFTRNLSNCVRPWGKCSFFDVCYKNDYSDLVQFKPERRE